MNSFKEVMKYAFRTYFKSNKFVMPFAVLMIFLYFSYSVIPVSILSSFTISMVGVFMLMVWIGLTYHDVENPISEQLIILKLQGEKKYYLCNIVFLLLIGIIVSIIAVFFPILLNILNRFQLYTRPIMLSDVLIALILHCFAAFTGSATGSLFHPRIIRDRKSAVLLALAAAIISMIKTSINIEFPVSKAITWIFPPVANFVSIFSEMEYYNIRSVLYTIVMLSLYSFTLTGIKIFLLTKNKF